MNLALIAACLYLLLGNVFCQLDCISPNYSHDESKNSKGPNRCSNNCDCDGMRVCSSSGWCSGTARPLGVNVNSTQSQTGRKAEKKFKIKCLNKYNKEKGIIIAFIYMPFSLESFF